MTRPNVFVEVAFNAGYSTAATARTWTDVTSYVFAGTNGNIDIKYARQDEHSQANANTCTLTLNNSDGRFTPGLATSPYYPNVKIGRPIRVALNLMTAGDNGTFEASATGWSGSNCSAVRSTTQFHSGVASLRLLASTAADMYGFTAAGTSGFPIAPNTSYRASAWFRRGGATSRSCDVRIVWYDAAGTLISTDVSAAVTDSTTWQQVSVTATSPATAAYAQIRTFVTAPASSEIHMVDDVRFDIDRFTGYVEEWPLEWPNIVSTFATTQITASSRMARMGLDDKLRSLVEEEILRDSPSAYYTLGDADGTTQASDSSGNTAPSMRAAGSGTAPVFGSAPGVTTDGLTGLEVTESQQYLKATLPSVVALDLFFSVTGDMRVLDVSWPDGGYLQVEAVPSTNELDLNYDLFGVNAQIVVTGFAANHTYHLHLADKQYLDGVQVSATPLNLDATTATYALGGPSTGSDTVSLSHVAFYSALPSAARVLAHATAGLTGFSGEDAATRLARYAAFEGIASAEYSFSASALTPMAHIDTTGQTPIDLMHKVEETDGGVLYDARRGVLTYKDRTVRYTSTAVLTLDVNSGEVEANYAPKLDRFSLINKLTAAKSDGTYSATAENTTSSGDYGTANPGDLDLATTSSDEVHAAAWWRVNTYGEPSARAPLLGVQIESLSTARQALILAANVSDKVTVTNLYSQSDATTKSFFVEGYTETIDAIRHRIEFNVSPTTGYDVWVVEDAVYGQYDLYPISY